MFHIAVLIPLLLNFLWMGYQLTQGITVNAGISFVMAVVLMLMALSLRLMALTVQDRVIRLEMRLRMARVLPADLQSKILSLTPHQLVALRFAGDEELPDLTREVLAGTLATQKAIKMKVKNWQGDFLRA